MKIDLSRHSPVTTASIVVAVIFTVFAGVVYTKDKPSNIKDAKPVPPFHATNFSGISPKATFLVFGDWGTGSASQKNIAQRMAEKAKADGAQFAVLVGDNFYPTGVSSVSDPQWKTKYADIYTQPQFQMPFYVALGNHDWVQAQSPQAEIDYTAHDERWHLPARYYTFSWTISPTSKIDFFALDTTPIEEGKTDEIKTQSEWLEGQLAKSTARWKIVFGHHPVYSNGLHGDTKTMVEKFKPLFEKYHVDAYLCGHDHDIEILKPVNGVHYIVSGGGAGHRDMHWGDNTVFAMTNTGFVWCAATDNLLEAQCIDRDGKTEYVYDMRK